MVEKGKESKCGGKLNFPRPTFSTPTHERLSSTDQARSVHLQTALVIRPQEVNRESRGNSFHFSSWESCVVKFFVFYCVSCEKFLKACDDQKLIEIDWRK